MAAIPCPNTIKECLPCADNTPFANLSAEAPDIDGFFAINHFVGDVPLDVSFQQTGCLSLCFSASSQQDADNCAAARAAECVFGTWRNPPTGDPLFPFGRKVATFLNQPQSCTVNCPDGSPFTYVVPSGVFVALSQSKANLCASSYACSQANKQRICLSDILPVTCQGQPCEENIVVTGEFVGATNTWALVGGSLPPGLSIEQGEIAGTEAAITGTPTTTGAYMFAVRVTDPGGFSMTKVYTLTVAAITTPANLPDATNGSAYSQTLAESGLVNPVTWSVFTGTLPPGLSLDSSTGTISGTPVGTGADAFTIEATGADGTACSQTFSLNVSGGNTACLPPPLAWWAFNAFAGGGFADTLFAYQINMTGLGIIQNPPGRVGNAAQYTSVAGTHDNPGLSGGGTSIGAMDLTGGFSLGFWVRFDLDFGNTGVDMQFANLHFFDAGNVLLGSLLVQYIASTQTFGVSCGAATAAFGYTTAGHVGVWNFIHATLDSGAGKITISLNGGAPVVSALNTTLAGVAAKITNAITMNPAANLVGNQTSLSVDEYALFGRKLKPAEIVSIYNGGLGIACPWPAQPVNIRIKNYNPALFTVCPGQPASGDPAWDGTLSFDGPMQWDHATPRTILGQTSTFLEVAYGDGTFPLLTPTGCGYFLEVALTAVDSWFGLKSTGLDPTGVYVRDPSSCSPGPATLTIESF